MNTTRGPVVSETSERRAALSPPLQLAETSSRIARGSLPIILMLLQMNFVFVLRHSRSLCYSVNILVFSDVMVCSLVDKLNPEDGGSGDLLIVVMYNY